LPTPPGFENPILYEPAAVVPLGFEVAVELAVELADGDAPVVVHAPTTTMTAVSAANSRVVLVRFIDYSSSCDDRPTRTRFRRALTACGWLLSSPTSSLLVMRCHQLAADVWDTAAVSHVPLPIER
jgi:hypothetical protein